MKEDFVIPSDVVERIRIDWGRSTLPRNQSGISKSLRRSKTSERGNVAVSRNGNKPRSDEIFTLVVD